MLLIIELAFTQLSRFFISGTQRLADMTSLDTFDLMLNAVLLANFLGFLALVSYILTLLPTILRVVFPNTKKAEIIKLLIKYRRRLGIISFWLTIGHGYLSVEKRNFDIFDLETYLQYFTGVLSFFIFMLLALTSNDWSVKKLGAKTWKNLHKLTYLAMFLLIIHIWLIMSGDWSYLTPIGLLLMTVVIALFTARKWIERKDKQQKGKENQPKAKLPAKVSFCIAPRAQLSHIKPGSVPTYTFAKINALNLSAAIAVTTTTAVMAPDLFKSLSGSATPRDCKGTECRIPTTTVPTSLTQNTQPLHTFLKHSTWVYAVAVSFDGQIVASGGYDKTVKIWHLGTGKLLHTLSGHGDAIEYIAISPDGQQIASGSWDNTLKLWNPRTGELIRTLMTSHCVGSVAFSPDGQILANGNQDGNIQLWNPRTGELIRTLRTSNWVRSVAFNLDGQTLASSSQDGKIKLWNLHTGELSRTLKGHSKAVRSVAFSPDGQILASGSYDRTIQLWRLETGALLRTLRSHSRAVHSVAFSPDGQILASGSYDRTIQLWRLGKIDSSYVEVELLRTLTGHSKSVWSVAFSPDGQLASGSGDKTVKIWRVSDPN